MAHSVVSSMKGRKIASLTSLKEEGLCFINFWAQGSMENKVTTSHVSNIFPSLEYLNSLEISSDMKILFGASTGGSSGTLIAFSFDKYFDVIDQLDFSDTKDCIMQKTKNDDIILLGGGTSLKLFYFRNLGFRSLRQFMSITSAPLSMIRIKNNYVFMLDEVGLEVKKVVLANNIDEYSSW